MQTSTLIIVIALLTVAGFFLGRQRSFAVARRSGGVKQLHSLPGYYGMLTALWCGVPALILAGLWVAFEPTIITQLVVDRLPPEVTGLSEARLGLVVNDIRNLVRGTVVSGEVETFMREGARP